MSEKLSNQNRFQSEVQKATDDLANNLSIDGLQPEENDQPETEDVNRDQQMTLSFNNRHQRTQEVNLAGDLSKESESKKANQSATEINNQARLMALKHLLVSIVSDQIKISFEDICQSLKIDLSEVAQWRQSDPIFDQALSLLWEKIPKPEEGQKIDEELQAKIEKKLSKEIILQNLRLGSTISRSLSAAGVSSKTCQKMREEDAIFNRRLDAMIRFNKKIRRESKQAQGLAYSPAEALLIKANIIKHLRLGLSVSQVLGKKRISIAKSTFYAWLQSDPLFQKMVNQALKEGRVQQPQKRNLDDLLKPLF